MVFNPQKEVFDSYILINLKHPFFMMKDPLAERYFLNYIAIG